MALELIPEGPHVSQFPNWSGNFVQYQFLTPVFASWWIDRI
jgi:hypothetical protein